MSNHAPASTAFLSARIAGTESPYLDQHLLPCIRMACGVAETPLCLQRDVLDLTLAAARLAGHLPVIIPVLHIAGTLAAKPIVPASNGTLPM